MVPWVMHSAARLIIAGAAALLAFAGCGRQPAALSQQSDSTGIVDVAAMLVDVADAPQSFAEAASSPDSSESPNAVAQDEQTVDVLGDGTVNGPDLAVPDGDVTLSQDPQADATPGQPDVPPDDAPEAAAGETMGDGAADAAGAETGVTDAATVAETGPDTATAQDAPATPDGATVSDDGNEAVADATLPDAPADAVDAAAPATTHNFVLTVSAAKPLPGNTLTVFALVPGQAQPSPDAGDKPLWQGPVAGAWPMTLPLLVKPGSWQIGVEVKNVGSPGPPTAMGTVCIQGQPALVSPTPAVQTLVVNLVPPVNIYSVEDLCVSAKPAVAPFIKTQSATQPPNTKDGGPHFMQALVHSDRLWVAGSQDGYVSFDFPAGETASEPFANWQVHGGQMCNRAIRVGSRLFCSSRSNYVHILDLDANQKPNSLNKLTAALTPTEGLMHREGLVYVAAHTQGMVAMTAAPPYSAKPVTVPADVTEAWDLALLGKDTVAVANGGGGLVFGSLAGDPYEFKPLGKLPLPGVSAYLSAEGATLAVGALGGGVHLINVANVAEPKLLTTLQFNQNAYGVALVGDQLFAAAGGSLLVGQQTAAGWFVRGGLRSDSFVLDVDVHGAGLLSAEFRTIRRMVLDPTAAAAGPVLVAPRTLTNAPFAVGATAEVAIDLRNLGNAPLTVSQILWQEHSMGGGGSSKFPGPWTVPPKGTLSVPLTIKKTVKGLLDHQFIVASDDPSQPDISIAHRETTWLHVGDKLPKLPVYSDGKGNTTNVGVHLFGKVGVVLVAAQSCPVAFQALAAARRDLAPLVAQGSIAAVAINPWDNPKAAPETAAFAMPFPMLYSGLTTSDGHDWSEVLDVTLGQPLLAGPPMPITYVVGKDGKLVLARWGYDSAEVLASVATALAK